MSDDKDYFIKEGGKEFAGRHYLLDVFDTDRLDDIVFISEVMKGAAKAAQATVLYQYMHHFEPNNGVTGVIVLAESHCSCHTWPERRTAAFDIFMCGDANIMAAVKYIIEALNCIDYDIKDEHRCVMKSECAVD
jgi:S-adenosylmethionine decarboxylase